MSPGGKVNEPRGSWAESAPDATLHDQRLADGDSLPLRLSVARGGLGLELCRPVSFGPLVVEELEVALPGISYPVDLSKGVKHFRNRRSIMRHAVIVLDLNGLSRAWERALRDSWGRDVRVRLRPIFVPTVEGSQASEGTNDAARSTSLSVSIYDERAALSFDLVMSSGSEPRIVVDAPRAVGRTEPALLLAVQAVDAGLGAASGETLSLSRHGRALELAGLCEAVALLVLPEMGCRLPSVEGQVVTGVETLSQGLRVTIGRREEPFSAGRRGLRVAGVAEFLRHADDALLQGDFAVARSAYLEALEQAPGHEETLFELAGLDLTGPGRAEAALSFVEELGSVLSEARSPEVAARFELLQHRALSGTGRSEAARESLEAAATVESDAVVAALAYCNLSDRTSSRESRRKYLDQALGRAPFLALPRRLRFNVALIQGDLKVARSDAEQLEAACADDASRSSASLEIARAFDEAGYGQLARTWLRRALRLSPDQPEIMFALARNLEATGERLRAAELFQTALGALTELLETDERGGNEYRLETSASQIEARRRLVAQCRFQLARLLHEEGDQEARVLSYLAHVETRSDVGVQARLMEASIFHLSGRGERRDRCLARLLEAIELGWVDITGHRFRLDELLETSRAAGGDPSLRDFANRVLENSAHEIPPSTNDEDPSSGD